MSKVDTKDLLKTGKELGEQRAEIVAKQGANRDLLRNLSNAELLSEEEEDQLAELYPQRERKLAEDEDEFEPDEDQE